MTKPKTVRALVTKPTFINNVLHLPGEIAAVDLHELGVAELGEDTPGLESVKDGEEAIEQVPVAPVAPFAPGATEPQQIPPGTKPSGTGRLLSPASEDQDDLSREMAAPKSAASNKPAKNS
jgi:hypothetical protein